MGRKRDVDALLDLLRGNKKPPPLATVRARSLANKGRALRAKAPAS